MVDEIKHYLKNPNWRRQHGWRRAVWQTMNRLGLTGLHLLPMNRRWIEIHRRKMPLKNLDPRLEGIKIIQLSDLHHSPMVWQRYLIQYVRWVNELEPDLVVITGDLITGGYRYAHRVATILSHIRAKRGVICTFGNHDYSLYGKTHRAESKRRGDYLEECLQDRGLIVLRNEVHYLNGEGVDKPVAIVGLDDEWTGNINPDLAWKGVDPTLPTICLNHNPANVRELLGYPWEWMLSGHTHGRQPAAGVFGKRFLASKFRHYTHGYYAVEGRHLYVNRGISYGQRVLHWCRPEVTVFKLTRAPDDAASTTAIAAAEVVEAFPEACGSDGDPASPT